MAKDDEREFFNWDDLPDGDFKWPCKCCGADQASAFTFDEDTMEVKGCSNCEALQTNTHIDSEKCWCHPKVLGYDEESGKDILHHWLRQ